MKKIVKLLTILISISICLCQNIQAKEVNQVPIYRLYSLSTKEHFFTQDINERNMYVQNGWTYEEIAWFAPSHSSFPVYRLYNYSTKQRYYSLAGEYKDKLIASGYVDEGIAWYSSEEEAVPVYENQNKNTKFTHFTTNSSEYNYLGKNGWNKNGISWYAQRKATKAESEESNRSLTYTYGYCYYVDGIMIVNKKHGLSSSYTPGEDPVAGAAIRNLISVMRSGGYNISTYYSGYRSYDTQKTLYNNYVKADGQAAADTYSARPGFSEHQTGLAFDLCNKSGQLVESTREVNWISQNAHKYGFIVRYKAGKEHITGYQAEPWHLRYLGVDMATKVYNSGLTLEEYLGVSYGNY